MPVPVAQIHRQFKTEFLGQFDEEDVPTNEYAEVYSCNDPMEVIDWMHLHPLLGHSTDPDKLLHPVVDNKTKKIYIVGLALGDRITIGDIDPSTGEILDGEYEETPIIVFAECTPVFLKYVAEAKKNQDKIAEDMGDAPAMRQELLRELTSNLKKG
jgi:hypothetical protein